MNDQNAKQEHNPWNRSPEDYGAPEWRLLNIGERIESGDEYDCKHHQCPPRWEKADRIGFFPNHGTTYRRRITPTSTPADAPTDAGEEVVHGFTLEPGETAADLPHWPEFAAHFEQKEGCKPHPRDTHTKLLFEYYVAGGAKEFSAGIIALSEQRHTIATLRAECEGLREDKARLDWLDVATNQLNLFGNFVMGGRKDSCRAAVDAAIKRIDASSRATEGK